MSGGQLKDKRVSIHIKKDTVRLYDPRGSWFDREDVQAAVKLFKSRMHHDKHNFGEMGEFVRLEYIMERMDEAFEDVIEKTKTKPTMKDLGKALGIPVKKIDEALEEPMKPSERIQEIIKERRDLLNLQPGESTPLESHLAILAIIKYLDEQHKT